MESQAHIDLVNVALQYVKKLITEDKMIFLQTDSAGSNNSIRVIGNYVPDIYYCFGSKMIIGEAKTLNDFENKHSQDQFIAYLEEGRIFQGTSILIVSVPWQLVPKAKNYFKRLKSKNMYESKIIIINEIGRCYEV